LELLCDHEYAVHELLAEIQIQPSSLSHQLAVLRRAGLISQTRRGGQVFYTISAPEIRDLLMASRAILLHVISDQDGLKLELSPGRGEMK